MTRLWSIITWHLWWSWHCQVCGVRTHRDHAGVCPACQDDIRQAEAEAAEGRLYRLLPDGTFEPIWKEES